MRRTLAVLALALGIGCGKGKPATPASDAIVKKLPLPTRTATLNNGLRVVLQEDHHAPTVAVHVAYRVGASCDPPGRSGFAHLFEHFMFEGSKHVKRGEFETLLVRAGTLQKNAFTTIDGTYYYEVLPSAQLDLALFLESDRMGFLLDALDQNNLDNVRSIVKNEYRWRVENVPYGLVSLVADTALYPEGHPYHRSVIGTPAELDAASLDDIKRFFLRWYAPNNATLVIVGDIDVEATLARVHHWFDAIPRAPDPPQIPAIPPPTRDKPQRIVVEADVTLPRVRMTWATPAWGQPGEPALASAATLAEWNLAGYVVKKLELAHSVSVTHRPGRVGSTFTIEAAVREGVNVEKVLDEISYEMDEMSRYARYWVDEKRVRESLYSLYADEILDFDGLERRARLFGAYDVLTGNSSGVADRLRAWEALDPDDVVSVYRDYIIRVPPVIVVVRPNSNAPVAGKVVSK